VITILLIIATPVVVFWIVQLVWVVIRWRQHNEAEQIKEYDEWFATIAAQECTTYVMIPNQTVPLAGKGAKNQKTRYQISSTQNQLKGVLPVSQMKNYKTR
jgi:hypothetical protein